MLCSTHKFSILDHSHISEAPKLQTLDPFSLIKNRKNSEDLCATARLMLNLKCNMANSFINYLLMIFIIIYLMLSLLSPFSFFSFRFMGTPLSHRSVCSCSAGAYVWYNVMFYASPFSWKNYGLCVISSAHRKETPARIMMYPTLSKSIGLIGSAVLALRLISSSR